MTGWTYSLFCMVIFFGLAIALERHVATRWFHHLAIAILALVLLRPTLAITGDISTVLPDFWSAGADGKDQIILVSVAATLTFPVIAASMFAYLAKVAVGTFSTMPGRPG